MRTHWLVLAAGVLAACGPSKEDACATFAQGFCDRLESCDPDAVTTTFGDSATCVDRLKIFCSTQYPPNSGTTPDFIQGCGNALTSATCDQFIVNGAPSFNTITECKTPAGSQDDGTLCFTDSQCRSTYCDKGPPNVGPFNGACGACAERSPLNGDCTLTACDFGLICVHQGGGAPNHCETPNTVPAGQNCIQDAQCQIGNICVGNNCTAVLGQSAPCQPGGDRDACDPTKGLFCDPVSLHCASVTYVAEFGTCNGGGPSTRFECTASSECINGICQGPVGDGQRNEFKCLFPASLVNNVCLLPDPALCE
jgi:hypothetical protein